MENELQTFLNGSRITLTRPAAGTEREAVAWARENECREGLSLEIGFQPSRCHLNCKPVTKV